VFADNSKEIKRDSKADVSAGRSFLMHHADLNLTNEAGARIDPGLATTLVVWR
jgi:hypothetical protein